MGGLGRPAIRMNKPSSPRADRTDTDRAAVNRLLLFFALVYVVEGVGQIGGLIAQPLSFYLKEVHGWTALQVTAFLAVFNFPWIIKPVYGVLSDFVPIFGYRRKTYLIAANIIAMGAYLWTTQLTAPDQLVWALQLTAYAMAISSTVCGSAKAAALSINNGSGSTPRLWLPLWSAVSLCNGCRRPPPCTPLPLLSPPRQRPCS
jgi:BT1 family